MKAARAVSAVVIAVSLGVFVACAIDAARTRQSVTIQRDDFGVPHVIADTPEALFYGGGYALMQDRMAQFDEARRQALGRRAELDASFLDEDRRSRLLGLTRAETQAMFEQLSPEHRRIMRALVAGINKAVDEALADPEKRMPYEFGVLWQVKPERWTLHDYISTYPQLRHTFIGNSELENLELYRGLVERYGEAKARIIFDDVLPLDDPDALPVNPSSGPFPASLSGTIAQAAAPPQAVEAAPRPFAQLSFLGMDSPAAGTLDGQIALVVPAPDPSTAVSESRSLMIGPKRSASGNVLMMQATSDGPMIRYLGGGFDAYGFTRPGGGPHVMGTGPTHGWLQNVGPDDRVDTYAEKLNPENPYQYWFQGEWRDMARRTETIQVRGRPDETIEVVTTVHGPVVAWDREKGLAYAEKNALRLLGLNTWVCSLEFMRARNLAEFERWVPLCAASATINYGGQDGTIAHWHTGRRPIRTGGLDPRLPTPGTGEYEWQGDVPFSEWSKFMDPPQGFFFAWNTRTTPAVPYRDSGRWGAATSRNYIAYDLMKEYDKVTLEDFNKLNRQLGNNSTGTIPSPKFFVPYLRPAVAGNPRLERAVELMAGWNALWENLDGDGYYDSPGLPLMERWLAVARETIVGGVLGEGESRAGGYETSVLHRAMQGQAAGLPVKFDWFGGRDRDTVLRETVARVVDELTVEYGTSDMAAWKKPIRWRSYTTPAAKLGLIPSRVPHNGSEQWNAIMELTPREKRVWDASPAGGQNLFIDLAGKATPNISDQLMRHVNFDLKRVQLDPKAIDVPPGSVVRLDVPSFD